MAAGVFRCCSIWLWHSTRTRRVGDELVERRLLCVWWMLTFATLHRFDRSRTALDVTTGSIAVENVIEVIAATLGIAFAVLTPKRRRLTTISVAGCALAPGFVFAFSTLYSVSPIVTASRSISIIAYGSMAIATATCLDADRVWVLVQRVLRSFVVTVAVLCTIGLLLRTTVDGRVTWPGVHPNTAGLLSSLSIVLLLVDRSSWPRRTAAVAAAAPLIAMNLGSYSRSATLCMVAVVTLTFIIAPRQQYEPRQAPSLAGSRLAAVFAVLAFRASSEILTRNLNGRDKYVTTSTLNGRTELWSESLNELHKMGREMYGVGFSASRVLLASTRSWAGTAHSGYLQLLLDVGYVGTILVGLALAVLLVNSWIALNYESRRTVAAFFLFLALQAVTSDSMVLPGPAAALIFLQFSIGVTRSTVARQSGVAARVNVPELDNSISSKEA